MLNRGIRKYASNPLIGLLPCTLFVVLRILAIQVEYALIIAFVTTVIGEAFLRMYCRSRVFSVMFYLTGIALITTFVVWVFTRGYPTQSFTYVVVLEAIVVCLFMLLRASKTFIAAHFFRRKNLLHKALMNEFYDSIALFQYGLTLHIFSILLYRQFTTDGETHLFDILFYMAIPTLIVAAAGVYEFVKIRRLAFKLREEEWLPIITEKGEVTGKIAKRVSLNMKNKFLHPVVRIALISNSKVYLQERPNNDILSPRKLDYPFEKYMLFSHEINLTVRNIINKMVGRNDLDGNIKFLLKYVFENDDTKRLIFLFVAEINDEHDIKRQGNMTGKFWTVKQLEDGFADEIFSECFELEFEYLKNMVLIPNDIFTDQVKAN